jgi:hypothetical protein
MDRAHIKEMIRKLRINSIGFLGFGSTAMGIILSANAYSGPSGKKYSMLNHYISELGVVSLSELYTAFNTGIIIGGICIAIFFFGFSFIFRGTLGKVGSIIGSFSGIFGTLVGFFPWDGNSKMHVISATGFFYGGMISIFLLTLALILEKNEVLPKYLILLGIIGTICFILFNYNIVDFIIAFLNREPSGNYSLERIRPDGFWGIAFFEWMSFISFAVWLLCAAIEYKKYIIRMKTFEKHDISNPPLRSATI